MASGFATFSKDEILAVNEAAVPNTKTNTKKETKSGLSVFTSRQKKKFLIEFATRSQKNDPRNTVN